MGRSPARSSRDRALGSGHGPLREKSGVRGDAWRPSWGVRGATDPERMRSHDVSRASRCCRPPRSAEATQGRGFREALRVSRELRLLEAWRLPQTRSLAASRSKRHLNESSLAACCLSVCVCVCRRCSLLGPAARCSSCGAGRRPDVATDNMRDVSICVAHATLLCFPVRPNRTPWVRPPNRGARAP